MTMDTVELGHWSAPDRSTGCTAIIFPDGNVASGEVRGGAPATREFALLDPRRTVQQVDAVILTGGSAFGLSAADGVVEAMVERDRGFSTRAGRVPIVVAMALFDLGDGVVPPGPAQGRLAVDAATRSAWPRGQVGAGSGATIGKWRGFDHRQPAGLGIATVKSEGLEVTAVVAVNAVGDIDDGETVSEVRSGTHVAAVPDSGSPGSGALENTTIGAIWTNAMLNKVQCQLVAESGHDGFGRALVPAHTAADGDALVAVSVGGLAAPLATVRMLATVAVEDAVRSCRGTQPR